MRGNTAGIRDYVDFHSIRTYISTLVQMIAERLEKIRQRIAGACDRAGRNPAEVTLIAVAKTFPPDAVREAVALGAVDVGENYVQELLSKREILDALPIRWHFIGHLQRNKVRFIVPWVRMIHAVDSLALASDIDRQALKSGSTVDVLVEVNTTGEESKFGVSPGEVAGFVRNLSDLSSINIAGLMTIGPFLPDPEGSRPMFRTLRTLRDEIRATGQRNASMEVLSMGMTGDFEVAIDEGATHVRIGTALFGSRTRKG